MYKVLLISFFEVFGFACALLEGLPIIGILFTISNQIGAAMWAHGEFVVLAECTPSNTIPDLEKRQALFRTSELKPLPPRRIKMDDGNTLVLRPKGTDFFSSISGKGVQSGMSDQSLTGRLDDEAHSKKAS